MCSELKKRKLPRMCTPVLRPIREFRAIRSRRRAPRPVRRRRIVFGDINDPESKVSKLKAQDRNYRLLQYLNVNTRTSYLARIRNPNPKMPDATQIGVASPMEKA